MAYRLFHQFADLHPEIKQHSANEIAVTSSCKTTAVRRARSRQHQPNGAGVGLCDRSPSRPTPAGRAYTTEHEISVYACPVTKQTLHNRSPLLASLAPVLVRIEHEISVYACPVTKQTLHA